MTFAAIPTQYGGHTFRSRLEATWAAFFDLHHWRWRYEPTDLTGYIPDFTIDSLYGPMVVEVKPYDFEALVADEVVATCDKVRAGMDGTEFAKRPFLMFGRGPFNFCGELCVGVMVSPGLAEAVTTTTIGGLCSVSDKSQDLTPTWDHIHGELESDLEPRDQIQNEWGYASDLTAYKGPAR